MTHSITDNFSASTMTVESGVKDVLKNNKIGVNTLLTGKNEKRKTSLLVMS